jgi:hypothetical protein
MSQDNFDIFDAESVPIGKIDDIDIKDVTFSGLRKWTTRMIQKFGWICICKNDKEKVGCYRNELNKLQKALENKTFSDPDKQSNKEILLKKIKKLQDFILNTFGAYERITLTGGKKKTSKKPSKKSSKKPSKKKTSKKTSKKTAKK